MRLMFLFVFLFVFLVSPFAHAKKDASGISTPTEESEIKEYNPDSTSQPNTLPYYEKDYETKPDDFKLLSMKKGVILGLLPINGAGLIYTGHRVTGFTLIATEVVISLPLTLIGAALMSESGDSDLFQDLGQSMFITGMSIFGVTYAIDAIATPLLIKKHNNYLKSAPRASLNPYVTLGKKGEYQAGVVVKF